MAFERVARIEEVPRGRGLCVRVGEREIGLYRLADGVYAMENSCPHAGYPLAEGMLEGTVVICNGHGWEYDVCTGRPPGVVAGGSALERYPVRVEGDEVWVDPDQPLPDPA